jgi:hypothetical protein
MVCTTSERATWPGRLFWVKLGGSSGLPEGKAWKHVLLFPGEEWIPAG